PDRARLLEDEAAGATAFDAVLGTIPDHRWDEPTVTPDGWTPIVLVAHVAGWLDECSVALEAMRAGTWDPDAPQEPVVTLNARQGSRAAGLAGSQAQARGAGARGRARA